MTKTLSSRERISPQEKQPVDLFSSQQSSDESSETTKTSVAQSPMQPPIVELQVVHATTGRVRIRATDGSHNSIFETISGQLRKQDGVKEVSVNEHTGSLVVNFDEKKLPLPQMLERLQQFNIHQLQASPEAKSKKDPFAAWKSPDFWKEQGISFIPLFTGLAVTGGLGISGLASIPIYYVTANATRRVIDELQSESKTSAVASSQKAKDKNKSSTKRNTTDHPSLSKSKSKVEHKSIEAAAGPAKIAYSVVHAIPGRIRLNVPRVARDRAYARRLERLLKTEPQVTNVRVNCDAASIAITYGSAQIPVSHWVGLMQLADKTIPETNLIKIKEQPLTQPAHQQGEPTTSTEQINPIKTTTEQALTQPAHQQSESTTSTALKEQAVVETDGLWSDFKSPALFTALSFMANFPLDPVPY